MAPVALAFAVLNTLHGSATDLGLVLAARQIPTVVFLLYGGVWADRLPRHRVMVASNVLSGASQAAAASLLLSGHASALAARGARRCERLVVGVLLPGERRDRPADRPGRRCCSRRTPHCGWRSTRRTSSAPRSAGSSSPRRARAGRSRSTRSPTSWQHLRSARCTFRPACGSKAAPCCSSCARAGGTSGRVRGCGRSSCSSGSSTPSRTVPCRSSGRSSRSGTSGGPSPGAPSSSRRQSVSSRRVS